jgi:molybdopterin molybdotransferase
MIPLEEAQARIFTLKAPVETEIVPLFDATGRWAATDIMAIRTQPAHDLSAMDGYAIRFADGNGPWTVVGESAAGRRYTHVVQANEAVRIFTGAVMPEGADTVIIQENIRRDGDVIYLVGDQPKQQGHNVRPSGGDFSENAIAIPAGAELHARHIALAAMAGHAQLTVRRKVRVAIMSTGDELVAPGLPCAEDQIPSSNDVMLAAMLARLPVEVTVLPVVQDDLSALKAQFEAVSDFDIIVTTGGASVGDHDLIVPALKAAGGQIDFWKIAMRPGKPVIAGRLKDAVVLGLPGNPVSAYVTAFLLLVPLIRHLGGAAEPLQQRLTAKTAVDLPANGPRTDHIRAQLHGGLLSPIGLNDSAMLAALSLSNALIIRDILAPVATSNSDVEYYLLP